MRQTGTIHRWSAVVPALAASVQPKMVSARFLKQRMRLLRKPENRELIGRKQTVCNQKSNLDILFIKKGTLTRLRYSSEGGGSLLRWTMD